MPRALVEKPSSFQAVANPHAPYRYVKFPVRLRYKGHTAAGICRRFTPEACFVSFKESELAPQPLQAGTQCTLWIEPAEESSPRIELRVELRWVLRKSSSDAAAELFLQLRCLEHDSFGLKQLKQLYDDFRFTIMVVDDDPATLRGYKRVLGNQYNVVTCTSGEQALHQMQQTEPAILITDQSMPIMTGIELLDEFRQRFPEAHTVRIVLSAQTRFDDLADFVNRCHISHFLQKPFNVETLRQIVSKGTETYLKAMEQERVAQELQESNIVLAQENSYLRNRLVSGHTFDRIIGKSRALQAMLQQLEQVVHSEATVHLLGETGTGKELVAQALHYGGPRTNAPFVIQNCAGITDSLMQSTLFGYKKGAFTGADQDRPGVFQQSHGGTLFLDEVAELSPTAQGALLRVLQNGEAVPVGSEHPVQVNVRIISATHKDLRHEVKKGRFREDLYFRLMVIALRLPKLSERHGDVPVLAQHFLQKSCLFYGKQIKGFSPEVMSALERYSWPGNVRELANEVERLVVLTPHGHEISVNSLSAQIVGNSSGSYLAMSPVPSVSSPGLVVPSGLSYDQAMQHLSRNLVKGALDSSGGTVKKAAELLDMESSRLAKLRKRLGL
ncbi:MAG: sigma-54-dependent Fis family transcriptional regulator [Myxococcales bacterium]|nr:MAG: sigma-54-dependent Fis family transcriptional regulator [Myxococcales bacterium]